MSTGAEIEVTNTNGKKYTFWVHADGYPEGIVCHLPDEPIDFEDFRRQMRFEDFSEYPSYYYEISLLDFTISIYGNSFMKTGKWDRGALLFQGTFAEAKKEYECY
jgi:hypothetical protein